MDATPERIAADYLQLLPLLHRKLDKPSLQADSRRTDPTLTHLQYHILEELYQQADSVTMTQLARSIQIAKQQLTPLIAKLEERDYVVKTPGTRDKRLVELRLTEKGRSTIGKRWEAVYRSLCGRLAPLEEEDRADLAYAVAKMTRILTRLEQRNDEA